jgi:GNAT superfamily N-acetyltransferase
VYSRLRHVYRKFVRNACDYGLGVAIGKALKSMIRPVSYSCKYTIYRIDLRRFRIPDLPADGLQYRLIRPDESALVTQIESLEEWLQGSLADRLKSGALCLIAMEGHKLAGFNLISFGEVRIPLIEARRTFGRKSAWSEQITVNPDFRGRGVATALRYCVFAELKGRGTDRLYGGTLASNIGSLKLTRRAGFTEIAQVNFRRWFRSKNYRLTRIARPATRERRAPAEFSARVSP